MTKSVPNDLSSAIDSGDGKLEIKNEHALIQIEGVFAAQGNTMDAEFLSKLRDWCSTEKRMNKETKGGYMIAWRKLEALIKGDQNLRDLLKKNCDAFREYVDGVESGDIVPTPTPPVSAVVTRQQGGVRRGVAALYGRTSSKPPKSDEAPASSVRVPPSAGIKIGNGEK